MEYLDIRNEHDIWLQMFGHPIKKCLIFILQGYRVVLFIFISFSISLFSFRLVDFNIPGKNLENKMPPKKFIVINFLSMKKCWAVQDFLKYRIARVKFQLSNAVHNNRRSSHVFQIENLK